MAYGIQSSNPDDFITLDASIKGGRCYVGSIYREEETTGTTTHYDYVDVPSGDNIRILSIGGDTHTYTISTYDDHARVTLVANGDPKYYSVPFTSLLVFTTRTQEQNYGILTTNDDGDTIVSAVYPIPQYVTSATTTWDTYTQHYNSLQSTFSGSISGTGSSGAIKSDGTGTMQKHIQWYEIEVTVPSAGDYMLMWSIPETTQDEWWRLPSASYTSTTTLTISFNFFWHGKYSAAPSYRAMPRVYVFKMGGFTASTDYGMIVKDAGGAVTFDSNKILLDVTGAVDDVGLTYSGSDWGNFYNVTSYTTDLVSDVSNPIFSPPDIIWNWDKNVGENYIFHAAIRRTATGIDMRMCPYGGDVLASSAGGNLIYTYKNTSGLFIMCASGDLYNAVSYPFNGSVQGSYMEYYYYDDGYYFFDGYYPVAMTGDPLESNPVYDNISTFTAYPSGGSGTYTYTWSLITNPDSMSFSGGTSSQSASITKVGSGTFTGTIRVVISDGVSTDVTIDTDFIVTQ